MASTLPRIHMVFMGMERIAARLQDLDILLRLLCRGAAAQKLGTYVSHISGPAGPDNLDGPEQLHLVILDNGRSRMLADPEFREMLCCIRCAACLNVCPVYGKIGGHAYGFAYSGPVGAVVTPLLVGINRAADLCQGETLCGACQDACPVNIDLPRMLLLLRAKLADGDAAWQVSRRSQLEKAAYQILVPHHAEPQDLRPGRGRCTLFSKIPAHQQGHAALSTAAIQRLDTEPRYAALGRGDVFQVVEKQPKRRCPWQALTSRFFWTICDGH